MGVREKARSYASGPQISVGPSIKITLDKSLIEIKGLAL